MDKVRLRPARQGDAADLAGLIDLASEGLTRHFWARMAAPGEDPMAVGAARAARDEGVFSWRNAVVAEIGGAVAGGAVIVRLEAPELLDALPPIARPLQALENLAPGTLYVNMLAVYPAYRRRGVARRLLGDAEALARGSRGLSLIVSDGNAPALSLYAREGFAEAARRPMVKEDWQNPGHAWLLMLKPAKACGGDFKSAAGSATLTSGGF